MHLEHQHQKMLRKPEIHDIVDSAFYEKSADIPVRFAVIGAGKIFDRWIKDANRIPSECQISVKGIFDGSEMLMRTKAEAYQIPICYDSYEKLLSDPEIDAVYVATPNFLHALHTIQALNAGKHVLCEKPIALNTDELNRMYRAAAEHNVFLMEGMWMRTLPLMQKLLQLLAEGVIGEVRYLQADCCNNNNPASYPAMFSKEKGGGALMDVGCYALHFAHMVFKGEPEVQAAAKLTGAGVDLTSTVSLCFPSGLAVLTQSLGCLGGAQASLHGTKGWIQIPRYLDSPSEFTIFGADGRRTIYRYSLPREKRSIGYAYEVLHFADTIRSMKRECSLIPEETTKQVLKEMDQIRKVCGVSFLGDNHDAK